MLSRLLASLVRRPAPAQDPAEPPRAPPPADLCDIPDAWLYRPLYSPWAGDPDFAGYHALAEPRTLVGPDRCYVLYILARQALATLDGEVWECGVYKGGTAAMLARLVADGGRGQALRLFDTFAGMPATDAARDLHQAGDFADTSLESVRACVGAHENLHFHAGFIPASFAGLDGTRIALAHIDVDIYRSVHDCLDFIWPRLQVGGFCVLDDYGFPTCPGARAAADEFFAGKPAVPLCLPTGQALVFKGSSA